MAQTIQDVSSAGRLGLHTISPRIRASLHDDGLVLLDTRKGLVYTSNRTGAQIWRGVAAGQSPRSIAACLSIEYGLPQVDIEAHTAAFLTSLTQQGILVPPSGSAG